MLTEVGEGGVIGIRNHYGFCGVAIAWIQRLIVSISPYLSSWSRNKFKHRITSVESLATPEAIHSHPLLESRNQLLVGQRLVLSSSAVINPFSKLAPVALWATRQFWRSSIA